METLTRMCWITLALVHVPPAAVAVMPGLLKQFYGVEANGDVGVLLLHRGLLFLAICVLCLFAALNGGYRRAASCVLAISVVGFLAVYVLAGAQPGPLRIIAIADALALVPLLVVSWQAWR